MFAFVKFRQLCLSLSLPETWGIQGIRLSIHLF